MEDTLNKLSHRSREEINNDKLYLQTVMLNRTTANKKDFNHGNNFIGLRSLLDRSNDDNDASSEAIEFDMSTRYGFIIISEALYTSTIPDNRDNHYGNIALSPSVSITESSTNYTNNDLGIDNTDTENEFFTGSYS